MPDLTPAAQKNLARGATAGAGTMVCTKCRSPKEEARLNSGMCKACDGGGTNAAARPYRDESDAALAWIVKMQMTIPDDLPHKRRAILQWAREQGFPG